MLTKATNLVTVTSLDWVFLFSFKLENLKRFQVHTYYLCLPDFRNRVDAVDLYFNLKWALERLVLALENRPQKSFTGGLCQLRQLNLDIFRVELR